MNRTLPFSMFRAALFAALALLADGCTSERLTVGQCEFDSDCVAGQACAGNVCRATCRSDADCPGTARCRPADIAGEMACVPPPVSGPGCVRDSDCASGQACLDGQCRPQCQTNYDCQVVNPLSSCSSGRCVPQCSVGRADCDGVMPNGCEVDVRVDARNCSACGRACPAGQVCSAGACRDGCADGETSCAGSCVRLASSVAHCGRCANACPTPANATPTCAMGACGFACLPGFGDCDGDASNGCEASLTAPDHCGTCATRCAAPTPACSTVEGRVVCTAEPCAGAVCGGVCVDTATDPRNCGRCGNACPAGSNGDARCEAGSCAIRCTDTTRYADCDGNAATGCEAEIRSDAMNCGACGTRCAGATHASGVCAETACAIRCDAGFGDCDAVTSTGCEVDTRADASHCGRCGNACTAPANAVAACAAGACAFTCNAGFADCDTSATTGCEVSTSSDRANCGACGRACAAGEVCSAGVCRSTCATGETNCAGSCANLATSLAHCGRCGNACPSPSNATPSCAAGLCAFECAAGFGDCDSNPSNGCETNLRAASAHCGACGRACSLANATAACSGGVCAVASCAAGFGDCDGVASNGCETNLSGSLSHCGACGRACSLANATAACSGGGCAIAACAAGFGDCDGVASNGCETNLRASAAHCGSCGAACSLSHATPACSSGLCAVAACATGWGDCDHVAANGCEVDLQTATGDCGACGRPCGAGQVCSGGVCASVCASPTTFCAGRCVNLQTDTANCGACANACPARANAAATCARGACGIACNAGFADCDGVAANGCEVNLLTATSNCGACMSACDATNGVASCAGGRCAIACNAGFGNCDGLVSNGCETSTNTTAAHCGACGRSCSLANATAGCAAGACTVAACNAGFGNCDGVASNGCETNTNASTTNCGACMNVCNATNGTATCGAGACGITCRAGFGNCDGLLSNGCETSTSTTVAHCGACGAACSLANATAGCAAGACTVAACNAGFADCDGAASNGCEANLNTSGTSCGRCGNVCAAGFVCNAGACTLDCGTLTNCSRVCVNLQTDVSNCGACARVCSFANATPSCVAGTCGIGACAPAWGNCDAMLANGCETSLLASVTNCGACGTVCSFANATAACSRGVCAMGPCATGFGNCDSVVSNGCEANLNTSTLNCGTCGAACTAPANGSVTCVTGTCRQACNAGYYSIPLGSMIVCAPLPAPQQIGPSSFSWSTTRRPVFSWIVGGPIDGARLQVCTTRACATVLLDVAVTGTSYTPTADLPAGRLYWRLFGRAGTNQGATASPVWQFANSVRAAARAGSFGVTADFNGDGYADFAVNDEYASTPTVAVFNGSAAGIPATRTYGLTGAASSGFGLAVSPAGDVNGDGYGDLIVGAPTISTAYVYLGSASGLTTSRTLAGATGSSFGSSVSWAGDTNNDGYGDVIVGACAVSCTNGAAYVFHGASGGIGTTAARTLSVTGVTGFGSRVQGAGELNNDALDDVIVTSSTTAYQYLGTATSPNLSIAIAGLSDVDFAWDVNGDGYGDVAAGLQTVTTTTVVHSLRVYPGGINGLGATPSAVSLAVRAGGPYVAGLGDTNNDGYGDVAWSSVPVSVRVVNGASTGLGATAVTFTPTATEFDFGWALWGPGDVNGDNLWDIIYEHTNTAPCRRVIKSHHGTTTTFSTTPATTLYLPLICVG